MSWLQKYVGLHLPFSESCIISPYFIDAVRINQISFILKESCGCTLVSELCAVHLSLFLIVSLLFGGVGVGGWLVIDVHFM